MDWQQARHPLTREPGLQTNAYIQAWNKHCELLQEHLGIWQMVERDAQPGSDIRSTARKCLDNTRSMIQACASINTDGTETEADDQMRNEVVNGNRKHSSAEPQNQPTAKQVKRAKAHLASGSLPTPAVHIPSVTDGGDLFTIDPHPTPISALLNEFSKATVRKGKRRRSEQDTNQPLGNEVQVNGGVNRATKRVKKKHEETVQPSAEEVEEYNKSFEAKVELRLKQNEQDRLTKASKKRKRANDGTEGADIGPGVNGSLAEDLHSNQITTQKRKSDPKEQSASVKQQETGATTDDVRKANTKRARRAAT